MRRRLKLGAKLAVTGALLMAVSATPAIADHSWGGYHWARQSNQFTVQLGDNLSTYAWKTALGAASGDWTQSTVLDSPVFVGATTGRKCGATSGRVEVCNAAYGKNGWLGLASVWVSGSHIVQATVKLNDSYYNTLTYDTPEWRRSVTCQEVGHTFGLDHQSEDRNVDKNTCMDYYSGAIGGVNLSPNQHDYDELALIYAHLDTTTTLAASTAGSGRGLKRVKDSLFVEDLGSGKKRFVWVFWKDHGRFHAPPVEG